MGYGIHITRRAFWADEGDEISLEEWETFARAQSDIVFPPVMAESGTVLFDSSAPGDVLLRLPGGADCPLSWFEGTVSAKTPGEDVIMRMHSLATALGARVLGEDGEDYGPDGRIVRPEPPAQRRGRLSRWLRRG